jgi:hypothetical protein
LARDQKIRTGLGDLYQRFRAQQESEMNENIQRLINQAGTDISGKWMGVNDAEKLAELIVKECVMISRTSTDGFSAGKQMEQHFGVK